MTSIVTRTAYGSALQSEQFPGLAFNMLANSTLNERFSIQAGVAPAAGVMPTVKYYCIGNGGHSFETGAGNIPLLQTLEHDPRDAALYNHLPFVLRAATNDLTTQQQASYGLRQLLTLNGTQYVAYWLKRLDISSTVVTTNLQTNNNGVITTTAFVPSSANLHPTASSLTNTGSNSLTAEYVVTSAPVPMTLTADDCTELMNACTILYGDPAYAIISEIGLCSGVDKVVTLAGGSGTFNEVIACQIACHVSAFHSIPQTATGLTGTINLGSSDAVTVLS